MSEGLIFISSDAAVGNRAQESIKGINTGEILKAEILGYRFKNIALLTLQPGYYVNNLVAIVARAIDARGRRPVRARERQSLQDADPTNATIVGWAFSNDPAILNSVGRRRIVTRPLHIALHFAFAIRRAVACAIVGQAGAELDQFGTQRRCNGTTIHVPKRMFLPST